jgi:hypothetical protein
LIQGLRGGLLGEASWRAALEVRGSDEGTDDARAWSERRWMMWLLDGRPEKRGEGRGSDA